MEDADWTVHLRRDDKIYLSVSRREETEQINKRTEKREWAVFFFPIDVIIAMSHCYYNEDTENKNV